jgi:hypothetical protein
MINLKKLLFVFAAFAAVLLFATFIIPSTLLASGNVSIEGEKVSAVREKNCRNAQAMVASE